MPHADGELRRGLVAAADSAGPLTVSSDSIATRVRRRRRTALVGATGSAILVVGVALATTWLARTSDSAAVTPAVAASYPRPFVCGEPAWFGPDAGPSRLGLTMALSQAAKVSDDAGPLLEVTFTADRDLSVRDSPATHYEVLYLDDGIVVGGGPLLNAPGDLSRQGLSLVGAGFDVGPGRPFSMVLGPRDRLCPGLSWAQVWSHPDRYEVIVVQGRVTSLSSTPETLLVDIPTLGYWPLLIARSQLPA